MKINRQELLNVLEIVKPGLANKEMIEQSTSFAFIDGKVVTYNDEISISHPVNGLEITGTIPAQELYQFLKKSKKDEIEIMVDKSEVCISSGKEKAGFALTQEIYLPLDSLKISDSWKKTPEKLIEAIKFCIPSCSTDMSRPILTCVNVRNDGLIEASDGYRLARYQIEKLPVNTFLLPVSSAKNLITLNIIEIAGGEGWIHFHTAEGTIFSSRIFTDKYPDTEHLFEVSGKTLKLPKNLGEILDRAGIFVKGELSLEAQVDITVSNNTMVIYAKSNNSWFKAQANVRYEGEEFSFAVNPDFLKEMCEKELSCVIGENKILFEGENWKHVISLFVKENV